ncbi:uncharacterized protein LOC124155192 [Ischnura elegans]|uniref:uncharacterized protein LOC124155192 n=1 Tax=Ischnura elegans TaxID=197161 RepID=UPI001ED88FBB|nr:uncharacterized protein LOC124155192 [Ischnura elegans]
MPNIRPLPEELQEVAKTQLNEDPKRLENDLAHIKDWLAKQPHLSSKMDDQFLVAFLRGCKYSLERTKEKLDFYYTIRSTVGDFFNNRDPMRPELQKVLDLGGMIPLPEPDDLGRRVFLIRVGMHDPNVTKVEDMSKVNFMILDYMLMTDDRFSTIGSVCVLDMSRASLAHAAQMSPRLVKQLMKCSQDAYPSRPKALDFVHTPPAFDAIFNLFKAFSRDKLKERIYAHGDDMKSLFKNIPQRILPQEYGGEAGAIDDLIRKTKKDIESFRDWYLEEAKYKSNESRRPGRPKTYEDLFGVEGSFRQLSVDYFIHKFMVHMDEIKRAGEEGYKKDKCPAEDGSPDFNSKLKHRRMIRIKWTAWIHIHPFRLFNNHKNNSPLLKLTMPNIRPLPPNLQEIANKQLNEDPKRIDGDLAHLRDWLSKQPHLKARTDDQFLTAFLRGCKFSLERTKEKIDFYYTSRTALKEFFTDRDPMKPEIQKILNLGVMLPLPEPDELGRRIFVFRSGRYDTNEFNITDICKVNFMLMDYMLMNDDSYNTAGVVSIGDSKDATMAHAAQMSPTLIKKIMKCSQDGYPFRIKKLLYINVPQFFETVFNLFRSFAKDKLQKRMHVYADIKSLYQDIPQKLLPNEYGGEAGSFEELSKDFKKQIESFRDWFIEDEKYGADESKRPGKPKSYEDLFGVEGSFRKLTVD